MKKSHILVLALSSIVVLSACERRQRPPKPAVAKTDDDKKKGEGTQVDTANPESENSPTPPATEPAPQALVKADFDKAILGLFKTQAEALKALGLGIEISLFDSVENFVCL